MAAEEYEVGSFTLGANITLQRLNPRTSPSPVDTITVVKGSGTSIENPIGDSARVYVSKEQFKSLKDDLQLPRTLVVVKYSSTPKPSSRPTYEEIKKFSHYTEERG